MLARWISVSALLAFAACGMATAQTASPSAPPDVAPDFSAMRFHLGAWTCKETAAPNNMGVGATWTSNYTVELDARWYMNTITLPPPITGMSRNLVLRSYITYDANSKRWVTVQVDNSASYGFLTSPGWSGNSITWTESQPTLSGQPPVVYTETKQNDTHYAATFVAKMKDGSTATYRSACTKNP